MPVYLFTFHAYQSWMPDHKRGYTRRGEGYRPSDSDLAEQYRRNSGHASLRFTEELQQTVIDEMLRVRDHQSLRLYAVATDVTHIHIVVAWEDQRDWSEIRTSIKTSISKRLNAWLRERRMRQPRALTDNASRKRIRDQVHLDYLLNHYLPKHDGRSWYANSKIQ